MIKMSRYLIMDARGFTEPENAVIFDTADSEKQAIQRSKAFGDIQKSEVCIYDSETDDVCWHLIKLRGSK